MERDQISCSETGILISNAQTEAITCMTSGAYDLIPSIIADLAESIGYPLEVAELIIQATLERASLPIFDEPSYRAIVRI